MRNFFLTLIALALAAIFVAAGLMGGPGQNLETSLMARVAEIRAARLGLAPVLAVVTQLGGAWVTLGVSGAAALWLMLRLMPGLALLLTTTVLVERLMVDSL